MALGCIHDTLPQRHACRSDVPRSSRTVLPGPLADQRTGPGVREQLSGGDVRLRQVAFPCRAVGSVDLTEAVTSFLMIAMSRSKRARSVASAYVLVCRSVTSMRILLSAAPIVGTAGHC